MVSWWRLQKRPKADRYTTAGLQLILAVLVASGGLLRHVSPLIQVGMFAALVCVGTWNCWRAYKMPDDMPEQL
jgi:hypothetical protein